MTAAFDHGRGALVACNASQPDWVRVFDSATHPAHWCAAHDRRPVDGASREPPAAFQPPEAARAGSVCSARHFRFANCRTCIIQCVGSKETLMRGWSHRGRIAQ